MLLPPWGGVHVLYLCCTTLVRVSHLYYTCTAVQPYSRTPHMVSRLLDCERACQTADRSYRERIGVCKVTIPCLSILLQKPKGKAKLRKGGSYRREVSLSALRRALESALGAPLNGLPARDPGGEFKSHVVYCRIAALQHRLVGGVRDRRVWMQEHPGFRLI